MLNKYHKIPDRKLRSKKNLIKKQLVIAVASVATLISANSFASDNVVSVDVGAQRTDKALLELAEEAGVQIIFSPTIAKKSRSSAIQGSMTLTAALKEMLSGTSLTYKVARDGSFIISEAKNSEEAPEESSDSENVDEEIIVTGSAIRNVEPTSKVDVYTSEDFDRMGISSVEEFLRKLPQNFSSLNTYTTADGARGEGGDLDSLNTGAADLFGLGADATLILINGRRTAESAVYEGGVVNITNLPLSSIDRIEVVLDGASARYGSDAVGGVINFITKKDYVGMETKLRVERGLNGGDTTLLSQLFGFNWDSGGVTGVLSYSEREAVSTFKAGHVTDDQTSRGGNDWRNPFGGNRQPGAISEYRAITNAEQCAIWDVSPPFPFPLPLPWCDFLGIPRNDEIRSISSIPLGSLPVGSDGVDWVLADLSPDNALEQSERLRYEEGTTTENLSLSLSVNQNITDYINIYTDVLYSTSESSSQGGISNIGGSGGIIPPSNAFNNTGLDLTSNYTPIYETENSDLPSGFSFGDQKRVEFSLGANIELPFRDWLAQMNWRYSREETEVESIRPLVSAFYADREPTGNEFVDNIYLQQQQVYFRYLELLASDDPNEALNLFGDGTVQSPFLSEIYGPGWYTQPASVSKGFSGNLDGLAFTLPGGEARFGFGFEYNTNYRDYSEDFYRNGDFQLTQEPTRDDNAVYMELNVPVVGEGQALPWMQSLELNLGVRWEEFSVKDGFLVTGIDTAQNPAEVVTEAADDIRFSHTSPRVGIKWQLSDEFGIRASWGESFSAPHFVQLLGRANPPTFVQGCQDDINHPLQPDVTQSCGYYFTSIGNPGLEPEVSTTVSYGFEWTPGFIDGLLVSANIRHTDYENRIGSIAQINNINDDGAIWPEEFVVRRDNGDIDYILYQSANFAERISESVDISVRYNFSTNVGDFQATLNTVYTGELYDRYREDLPKLVRVGTNLGPQDWKGRFMLNWNRDNYGANMTFNYESGYTNIHDSSSGGVVGGGVGIPSFEQEVDHHWTLDLTGHYDFGDGWRLNAGATDITGNKPPFFDSPQGFDLTRWNPVGRLIYAEIKKDFNL